MKCVALHQQEDRNILLFPHKKSQPDYAASYHQEGEAYSLLYAFLFYDFA